MKMRGLEVPPPDEILQRVSQKAQGEQYRRFQGRYWSDPAGFARDCIDWRDGGLFPYQERGLQALAEHDRVSIRGPRGPGKTALVAIAILWFALTRDGKDWKVVTTASVWRQLTHYLWPEIHKWSRRLDWHKIGRLPFKLNKELLKRNLTLSSGEVFAVASNDPESTEGAHAENVFLVFDESKIIPDETWDSAEGAMASGNAKWIAISTPGEPSGRFYQTQTNAPGFEEWHAMRISLEEAIEAGQVHRSWVDARRTVWGVDSSIYRQQAMAEFAADRAGTLIPLAWIEAAQERWQEWASLGFPGTAYTFGVDVGGGVQGNDESVVAVNYSGFRVREMIPAPWAEDPDMATMELAGHIVSMLNRYGESTVYWDVLGLGAGVGHRLKELGKWVAPFNSSYGTELLDMQGASGFANWRSAAWWIVREILDPANGMNACLPPDDRLVGDLTIPTVRMLSTGKRQLEDKGGIKKRLNGRSPDHGDALAYAWAGPILWEERIRLQGQVRVSYEPVRIGLHN